MFFVCILIVSLLTQSVFAQTYDMQYSITTPDDDVEHAETYDETYAVLEDEASDSDESQLIYDCSEHDIEADTPLSTPDIANINETYTIVSDAAHVMTVNMSNVESVFKVRRMQEFHIKSNELYITERCDYDGDNSQDDFAILKFTITNGVANYTSGNYTVIKNAGHGETLDCYTYNNTYYFLVGCKDADMDLGTGYDHYALQIGRVEFSAGAVYNYSSIKRLTGFGYANQNNVNNGTPLRVAAATSGDKIVFRALLEKNTVKYVQYSTYSLSAVNNALSNSASSYISFASDSTLQGAHLSTVYTTLASSVRPRASFQGIEASPSSIYIAGGVETDAYPRIASISMTNGSFIGGVEIRGYVNQNGITVSCANKEIEGLYRTSDKIYFGIVTSISNIVIVSVNVSDF